MTKALEHLETALEGDFPVAFHIFGEIIQYESNYGVLPMDYIELYNLTNDKEKCEVSTRFYAKSVLRGYLKPWLNLA